MMEQRILPFEDILVDNQVGPVVGEFFEDLVASWVDGMGLGRTERKVRVADVEIDIVVWSDPTLLFEVKAFNFARGNFAVNSFQQITKYEGLVGNNFPFQDATVYYLFVGYRAKPSFTSCKLTADQIRRALLQGWKRGEYKIWLMSLEEARMLPERVNMKLLNELQGGCQI